MAAKAGKNGKVGVAAATVANLNKWKADIEGDIEETTALLDDWKKFTPTLKGGKGSAEGNWDVAADTTGQKAFQDALLGGTEVALKLYVDATNYYSGQALITKMSPGVEVKGIVSVSFDFTFTGAVTYA